MAIARYRILVEKAIEASLAAVEIYNKPNIQYREETFSILMLNAWEILLKARMIQHTGKLQSIHELQPIYKKDGSKSSRKKTKLNRSDNPISIGLQRAANLVREYPNNGIDDSCLNNLLLLQEIRDNSVHFHNVSAELGRRIQEVGAAALKNFVVAIKYWFGVDLKRYNFYLMPLTFHSASDLVESLGGENEPQHVRRLLSKISEVEQEYPASNNQDFVVTVQVKLKFVRTSDQQSVPVHVSPDDPDAISVMVSEDDILKYFPWNYGELTQRLKLRYNNFKVNTDYHKIRKTIENEQKFCRTRYLDPKKKNNGQQKKFYSTGIFSEFDKYYYKNEKKV